MKKLFDSHPKLRPILAAEENKHYRCKVTSTFAFNKKNGLFCGIYAQGSHKVIKVESCYLHNQLGDKAVQAALQATRSCKLTAFDEDKRRGLLRHVVVRVGKYTGQLMVTVVTASPEF